MGTALLFGTKEGKAEFFDISCAAECLIAASERGPSVERVMFVGGSGVCSASHEGDCDGEEELHWNGVAGLEGDQSRRCSTAFEGETIYLGHRGKRSSVIIELA